MYQNLLLKRGLSLDRLQALVDVADSGGISAAVGPNAVRQSLRSRQLKELEEYFGVELTRRSGRCLRMTPFGARLAKIAREGFQGLSDFKADCRKEPVVLRIGAGDSLIQWLLAPRLAALKNAMENVCLALRNLRTAEVVRQAGDLRLDFGLVRREAVSATLKSRKLGKLTYTLFAPKTLTPADAPLTAEWVLANLPLATVETTGEYGRQLHDASDRAGIPLRIHVECDSLPAVCRVVTSGLCAAVLPTIAAESLPVESYHALSSPLFAKMSRDIHVAWNPRLLRIRDAATEILPDMLRHLRF